MNLLYWNVLGFVLWSHHVNIGIAETNEFLDITSAVPSDFSDQFNGFAETLIKENNMENNNTPYNASSTFDLPLYLFSKIEEYSYTTLNLYTYLI